MTHDALRDELVEALADAQARVALVRLGHAPDDELREAERQLARVGAALAAYDQPRDLTPLPFAVQVPSRSQPGVTWTVRLDEHGRAHCPCPAYRECWHVRRAKRMRVEPLRVFAEDVIEAAKDAPASPVIDVIARAAQDALALSDGKPLTRATAPV